MKLRIKTLAIVALAVVCLNVVLFSTASVLLLRDFQTLETQDVELDIQRALGVLSDDATDLDATAQDYSEWDDTYAFMRDRNPAFLRSNFLDRTFDYLRLNLLIILDLNHHPVFHQGYDLEQHQVTAIPDSFEQHLTLKGLLPDLSDRDVANTRKNGLLVLPEGPMLVAARPIVNSDGSGPVRGTLVMGRYLTGRELERLTRLTQLRVTLRPLERDEDLQDQQAIHELLIPHAPTILVQPLNPRETAGYAILDDLYNQPGILVRTVLDRRIFAQGKLSLRYLLVLLVLVGLVFGITTLVLLERLVLSRLTQVSNDVREIGSSGDVSMRVEPLEGTDEMAELVTVLNSTLDRVEDSQGALKEAEVKYRSIFENAVEGIFQTTPDGIYCSVNPALAAIYGYDSAEAFMDSSLNAKQMYVDLADRQTFMGLLEEKGAVKEFEARMYRRNGEVIWISESARAVRDGDGTVVLFEGTVEDITERKASQEALRAAQERLEAILRAVPGSVSRVGRDLAYLQVNYHLAASFNLPMEDFIGEDIGFLGYGKDFRMFMENFFAGSRTEESCEIERMTANGLENYLVVAQKYDNNQAAFVVGIEVTEQRKAVSALREAEGKYRSIFENAIEGIFQATVTGQFTAANPSLAQIYGYASPAQLIESFNQSSGPHYVKPNSYQELLALLQERGKISRESEVFRRNGDRIWIMENATAVRNDVGQLMYYEGTVEDITEQKRSQEAMLERSRLSILEAEVGVLLSSGGEVESVLRSCTELMVNQLECLYTHIWTVPRGGGRLELKAYTTHPQSRNLDPTTPLLVQTLQETVMLPSEPLALEILEASANPEPLSPLLEIAQTMRPVFRSSPLRWKNADGAESFEGREKDSAGALFFVGHPLVIEGRLVGVMTLHSVSELSDGVYDVLGWVASSIAVGIDRSWARQALRSRREALLLQLASQIRDSLDLSTILEAAVAGIRTLLKVDRCLFAWCRPEEGSSGILLELESEAYGETLMPLPREMNATGMTAFAGQLMTDQVLRASDVLGLAEPLRSLFEQQGFMSVLAMPLVGEDGRLGVIQCGDCLKVRSWTDSDIDLLRAVTEQVNIAIQQSALYSQARSAAQEAEQKAGELESTLDELKATQTQLIQTEKMSSLGQMVAGVAHEINNPTTFIHGNLTYARSYTKDLLALLQLYQQQYPEPEGDLAAMIAKVDFDFVTRDLPKTLSSMQIGADRIRQIVASLRNFSRLDQAEMKPVNIHEGLDNTLMILQHRFKPNSHYPGIAIEKDYGELPLVVCYAGQLNQVFMNIISNGVDALEESFDRAVKASRNGAARRSLGDADGQGVVIAPPELPMPTILIATERLDGDRVRIRIRDTGPGIDQEVAAKLFDPFFTTKPVGQGTGLGLSISYQIVVDKHRGRLTCQSEEGNGTEFCIEIPIEQPEWNEST